MIINETNLNRNWTTYKLAELGEFSRGKSKHRPRDDKRLFENGKYPLIQTGDISNSNLYVTKHSQMYSDFGLSQSKLWPKGTLCITIAANVAEVAILAYPMCFPDSIVGFNADSTKTSNEFMYYVFKFIQQHIQKMASGSIQDNINIDYLLSLEFKIPTLKEQDAILRSLLTFDNKIENNTLVNDNLADWLKCKYQYLFVQHRDKSWKKSSIANLAKLYQPKTLNTNELVTNGTYLVYGANGIIGQYNEYNHENCEIAVACRGNSCGTINMTLPQSWITGNAMVVSPTLNFPYKEYLYYTLLCINISYLASGSGQPQLTRENMSLYNVCIPPIDKVEEFENLAIKARKIIIKNEQENIRLTSLRSWLLPMLMNGQAYVSD